MPPANNKRSPKRAKSSVRTSAKAVPSAKYASLLKQLQKEILQRMAAVRKDADDDVVRLNWWMGESIYGMQQIASKKKKVISSLAIGMEHDVRLLYVVVQFYRTYPDLQEPKFTWNHYRYLIQIKDPKRRRAWEKRIAAENLNGRIFFQLLSAERRQLKEAALETDNGTLPPSVPGKLYHYRVVKKNTVNGTEPRYRIDLGLKAYTDLPLTRAKIDNSRIVETFKDGDSYRVRIVKATTDALWTYKALVERVIDVDTWDVDVDVGFGTGRTDRLRLNGIDGPELSTTAGQAARQYIIDLLADCPFVIIKTSKTEKFARYLADIFYLPGETDPHAVCERGRYLNAQLVEEGWAKVWKG